MTHLLAYTSNTFGGSPRISRSCLQSFKWSFFNPTNLLNHVGRLTIALPDIFRSLNNCCARNTVSPWLLLSSKTIYNDTHFQANTSTTFGGSPRISRSCLHSCKSRHFNPTNLSIHQGRVTISLLDTFNAPNAEKQPRVQNKFDSDRAQLLRFNSWSFKITIEEESSLESLVFGEGNRWSNSVPIEIADSFMDKIEGIHFLS